MQGLPLNKYPTRDVSITDTISPHIPIYFIHSFAEPFCTDKNCQCFVTQKKVMELFIKLVEGKLDLQKVSDLKEK